MHDIDEGALPPPNRPATLINPAQAGLERALAVGCGLDVLFERIENDARLQPTTTPALRWFVRGIAGNNCPASEKREKSSTARPFNLRNGRWRGVHPAKRTVDFHPRLSHQTMEIYLEYKTSAGSLDSRQAIFLIPPFPPVNLVLSLWPRSQLE
jgi:hypothetical protein